MFSAEHIRIARDGCESLVLWIVANPTDPKMLSQIGETSNAYGIPTLSLSCFSFANVTPRVTSASQKVLDLLNGVPSAETQPLVNSVKVYNFEKTREREERGER